MDRIEAFLFFLNFDIHKTLRLLFLGLFTTAIYMIYIVFDYIQNTTGVLCTDDSAIRTKREFKILLIARNDFK
jgi:hypothetical protein